MIFQLNLEKAVFKLMQNLTSKLQFNGFLFSERVLSTCSWQHSHHCLCLVLWMLYLVCLMFSVNLSQGLYTPFFYICLTLRLLFLGESSWIVHSTLWYVQWCQMTPSYLLCCLVGVQCIMSILFSLIHQYIYHCMNNPTSTLQGWLLGGSFGLFWTKDALWVLTRCESNVFVYLFKFFPYFWSNIR